MSKLQIIIEGKNIKDLKSFFVEMDRVLTKGLDWETGHNLNAFNDLLVGGFGMHDYEEPIELLWKDFNESKGYLNEDLLSNILNLIRSHLHIEFRIID